MRYEVVGLNASPLLYLIDSLPFEIRPYHYHFYFDNLFTCLPLLFSLDYHGYAGTGTVRANRFPDGQPFATKPEQLNKLRKGEIERGLSTSGLIEWNDCQFKITQWADYHWTIRLMNQPNQHRLEMCIISNMVVNQPRLQIRTLKNFSLVFSIPHNFQPCFSMMNQNHLHLLHRTIITHAIPTNINNKMELKPRI